jgi:hypothetical protein
MEWVVLRPPSIAEEGHFLPQTVHPVHFSASIVYVNKGLHTFAGHFL